MRICLDTNRYTDAENGEPSAVATLQQVAAICIPVIVLGELRYGFSHGSRRAENEAALVRFLSSPRVRVIDVDDQTTKIYADLHSLRRQATPIPTNDICIAAISVQYGLDLYTHDRHFERLPQVRRI